MERAREGVVILLNDVWHSAVVLWIKFKFSWIKVYMVVGHGPNDGDGEKRDEQDSGLRREWI